MRGKDFEPAAHQLIIIGFIPCRAAELFDAGFLGDGNPDFGSQHSLHVQGHDRLFHVAECRVSSVECRVVTGQWRRAERSVYAAEALNIEAFLQRKRCAPPSLTGYHAEQNCSWRPSPLCYLGTARLKATGWIDTKRFMEPIVNLEEKFGKVVGKIRRRTPA